MTSNPGNEGYPTKCTGYWHQFKVKEDLPAIYKDSCYQCLKHSLKGTIEQYNKDKKAHANLKTTIIKMQKVLKVFYQKNPDLALEE